MTRTAKTRVVTRSKYLGMDAFLIKDMSGNIDKVYPFKYHDPLKAGYDITIEVSTDFFVYLSILQHEGYTVLF